MSGFWQDAQGYAKLLLPFYTGNGKIFETKFSKADKYYLCVEAETLKIELQFSCRATLFKNKYFLCRKFRRH